MHRDGYSSQNRSLRYLSAESHKMVTMTASSPCAAHSSAIRRRTGDSGGGGNADQQPLFARQPARHRIGGFGRHFNFTVRQPRIIDARHNRGLHVLQTFQSIEGRIGFERNALDGGIQFLQSPRRADKCAAGAQAGQKMRDAAFSLPPDFVRRGFIMRAPVVVVRVLVGVPVFFRLRWPRVPAPCGSRHRCRRPDRSR